MNLEVGDDDLTADKDYKHVFKRLRNLLLRIRGLIIHGIHITPAVIRSHLRSNGLTSTRIDSLLKPEDKQDVKLAYDLLHEIWSLPPASKSDLSLRPGFTNTRSALRTLGSLFQHIVVPYLCVDLSLSEQLVHLGAAAHILLALLREGNAGSKLMPTQLYTDIMIMIKNAYFCVAKAKIDDPTGKFWIILLGTDRLEELFGILRTMVGNDANVDNLQLVLRLTGTTEVSTILAKYPHWDRAPRRLKLPALSKDGFDVHKGVDHIKPPSWRGDVRVSNVNLQTCWMLGRQALQPDFPHLEDVLKNTDPTTTNILRPFAKDFVGAPRDAEDYDDTAEDFDKSSQVPVSSEPAPGPTLEDAAVEEGPAGKHSPCFELDGQNIFKSRFLNEIFKDYKNPNSRDRLKRVANVPRYAVKHETTTSLDIVDHDDANGVPSIRMDSPIATLVKCENHLFVCIGEVNDITMDSKHLEEIALELLAEPSVQISYQMLFLIPATREDDPSLKNDWCWSLRRGSSHRISGCLVEPINPPVCTRNLFKPFYLFESGVLMALGSSILERLTHEAGRLVPEVVHSDSFPYRESTGMFSRIRSSIQFIFSGLTFTISIGKACFVCEADGKEDAVINHRQCTDCTPTVYLPKSPQRTLEHRAGHMNFDPRFIVKLSSEPCGLCGRPSPACVFYLKKGKGTDASPQINYQKSSCANMQTFSYTVAAVSSASSPCSNVPMTCQWCPKSAPAVWKYNMSHHVKQNHPYVSLRDHESLWKISDAEKYGLKMIWDKRHTVKSSRKGKKKSKAPLVISEAHNTQLTLW